MAGHKHHSVVFPSTDWDQVRQAVMLDSDAGRLALEQLCKEYRPVIRAYMSGVGLIKTPSDVMDADDLTQEFLSGDFLHRLVPQADASRGRFRHFILHGLRLFLMSHKERLFAQKRGAGIVHENIEDQEWMPGQTLNFRLLDLPWALAVFQRAARRMRQRYLDNGELDKFDELWRLLWSDAASKHRFLEANPGVKPDAVNQRLRRFRVSLRECLRHEVERTVLHKSPAKRADAVEEEMADLIEVLAKDVPADQLYGCL